MGIRRISYFSLRLVAACEWTHIIVIDVEANYSPFRKNSKKPLSQGMPSLQLGVLRIIYWGRNLCHERGENIKRFCGPTVDDLPIAIFLFHFKSKQAGASPRSLSHIRSYYNTMASLAKNPTGVDEALNKIRYVVAGAIWGRTMGSDHWQRLAKNQLTISNFCVLIIISVCLLIVQHGLHGYQRL